QYVLPAALAANEQLAVTPVNVIEPEPGDLACAQPEPRQHQQDRSAHTRSRALVTLRLGHSRARNKLTSAAHNRPRPSPPRPSRPARNSRAAGPYKTRTVCADSPRSIRKYRRESASRSSHRAFTKAGADTGATPSSRKYPSSSAMLRGETHVARTAARRAAMNRPACSSVRSSALSPSRSSKRLTWSN